VQEQEKKLLWEERKGKYV